VRRKISAAIIIVCVVMSDAANLFAHDWPHWRGPTRDGLTKETSDWTKGEWLSETPVWKTAIGMGSSSPLIFRDRVYVIGWEKKLDLLRCLDVKSGKEEWSQSYPCPSHGRFHKGEEMQYGGPSATPEIDTETGLLYSLGIDGDLACWDLNKNGRPVWSLNLYQEYQVKQRPKLTPIYHRDYGYTSSPLVFRDWVIVEVGSTTKGTFVAFDKKTGKEAWRSELMDEAGHSGGLAPITVNKIPCLAGFTQRHVAIFRLDPEKSGETVAKIPWVTEGDCNLATPLVVGNSVLITSAYNQNAIARFDVDLKGMTEVWKKPFPSKVCSPVFHEGSVYYSWMSVHCLDWRTGEKRWVGGSYGDAGSCVVTSDGRLIVYGHRGKIGLIEGAMRSPKQFKELAVRNRIFDATAWPHIAVGSRCVVCRDKDGNLACYSIAKSSGLEK
jgi:outer membrane protein assembly factor BamB